MTAEASESTLDAARRMAEFDVGDLIVVVARPETLPIPIGIITDRDLVIRVMAKPERDPATTKIAEIMRDDVVTAHEDDDIEHVVEKMRIHAIRRIPVVDRRGGLQGVLSLDDVLGWVRDQMSATSKLLEHQGRGPHLSR